ncbi:MAG: ATP-binding protein, partial [Candidatus Binatia bacterium]
MALVYLIFIVLVLMVSVSTLSQFDRQSDRNTAVLTVNAVRAPQERRLLEIFLFQRRSVEKYLVLRDPVFLEHFTQGSKEFSVALDVVASLVKTPEENALIRQIRTLHARYADGLAASGIQLENWKQERVDLSERIVNAIQDLIHLSETQIATDIEAAGRAPTVTPKLLRWFFAGVLGLMIVLLYVNALRISQPLKQLSHEMQRVSLGEFRRSLRPQGPSEVVDVMRSFNQMTKCLAELDERQGDFLAQISHELRTPLTAIREGSSLLLEEVPGTLNTPQREIVQVVQNNSERLFRQLTAILDLSRMEAKKMEYSFVATDLLMLMRRSVESIGLIAQKKHQKITVHAPSPLPIFYVDEDRILQVLDNLLNNAVKFAPERGEIHVSASMQYDTESGERWAEIRVRDSGIGVPPEDAERIFLKFYQGSPGRWQAGRGSGLGLAISRHIVEAHGGRIWVESRS